MANVNARWYKDDEMAGVAFVSVVEDSDCLKVREADFLDVLSCGRRVRSELRLSQ